MTIATPPTVPPTSTDQSRRPRSGRQRFADACLTFAAVGGVICILLVIAALAFHVSLIMFKTGSMSPTIPAGSLAVVHEIAASEARVGDVLTIARPGELPITHRATSVTPLDGGLTSITMQGDANDFEDPSPYVVSTVRIVLYSVPGLAAAVVAVSHPLALGSITIGAALLVTWAFWPRGRARDETRDGQGAGGLENREHGRRRSSGRQRRDEHGARGTSRDHA